MAEDSTPGPPSGGYGNIFPLASPDGSDSHPAATVQGQTVYPDIFPVAPPPSTKDTWADAIGMVDASGVGVVPTKSPLGLDTSITPSPNAADAPWMPFSRDPDTGRIRLALPNSIRALLTEGPQTKDGKVTVPASTYNPETGTYGVTPEAAAGAALVGPSALRFSGGASLVRPPSGTFTPPLKVTLPELKAAISRADQPPPTYPPFEMPPPAPPSSLAEAIPIRDQWYGVVDQNDGAAYHAPFGTAGIDDAVKTLAPKGPLSAGTADPAINSLSIKLSGARDQPITLGDYAAADRDLTGLYHQLSAPGGNPAAAYKVGQAQAGLRDHFENSAGPDDVVGGQAGFEALDPARQAHTQVSKMEDLEDMIYKAGLPDAPPSSMRTQLSSYLSGPRSQSLTDMERAAHTRAMSSGFWGSLLSAPQNFSTPLVGAVLAGPEGALALQGVRGGISMVKGAIARARVQDAMKVLGQGMPSPPPPGLLGEIPPAP